MELNFTTIIFEIINFAVLMALLFRFLFKPVRRVLKERQQELEHTQHEAEAARLQGTSAQAMFEARTRALEEEAQELRRQAKAEGEVMARQLVEEARAENRRLRASLDAEIERARVDALRELRPQLMALTIEAAQRMLSETGSGDLALAFARGGARKLAAELAHGQAHGQGRDRVHARVSPDADVYALSMALKEELGDREISVSVDDSVRAGVILTAGGLEVEASAGVTLRRWFAEGGAQVLSQSPAAGLSSGLSSSAGMVS